MIRDFEYGDQHRFTPNEHSGFEDVPDLFESDEYDKYTLVDEGDVKCILCWKEYAPDDYCIFFLMPDGIDPHYARELRKFLDKHTDRLKPKSCVTYSFDCDMLNRWHKFFRFVKEEGEEKIVNGLTFNRWIIKWA